VRWYLDVLKKYAEFSGRARRAEYWFFTLFNGIAFLVLAFIDSAAGEGGGGVFMGLYGLAVMIPSLAVSVRRLHDTGRSGAWLFLGLIPLIGGIVMLVFMVQDSDEGENQYGVNPKAVAA